MGVEVGVGLSSGVEVDTDIGVTDAFGVAIIIGSRVGVLIGETVGLKVEEGLIGNIFDAFSKAEGSTFRGLSPIEVHPTNIRLTIPELR